MKLTPKAQWIWFNYGHDCVNAYMQARRRFTLKKIPRRAPALITADAKYQLFVNGIRVCRGPARGFQASWPVDRIDLSPYLRRGRNVIGAWVHNPGVSTFQYIHRGIAGFLFDCRLGSLNLASGPEWRVRRDPSFRSGLARLSLQLGFQEHYDARKEDGLWLSPAYGDSAWEKPFGREFGCEPWTALEERGIPFLEEGTAVPVRIVSEARGVSGKEYVSAQNVVDLYNHEKMKWRPPATPFKTRQHPLTFTDPGAEKNSFHAYCLDFGREVAGALQMTALGGRGNEIVDALATESLTNLVPDFAPVTEGCYVSMGARLHLRKDRTRHECFDYWGFRYLILIVRNSEGPLKIGVRLNTVGYPLKMRGSFSSSDPTLNAVHAVSVRTQKRCMFDAYVDCPWREQAQWWGDARVQARNTFYLSADARLFKRGIRQIGSQQIGNGLTYGHAPTYGHNCILPDFTLAWITSHYDYYWQTGDLTLFREMKSEITKALEYFRLSTAKNGLIGYDRRYWLFLDWADLFKEGYPTLYNLYYVMALASASALFYLAGDGKMGRALKRRERSLRGAILRSLFDPRRKIFHGGLTWHGKPVLRECVHTYALAVILDIEKAANPRFVREKLLPLTRETFPPRGKTGIASSPFPSPFFMNFIFEALKKEGEGAVVVDAIRRWWGRWIDDGFTATPEVWHQKPGHYSLCHAWSAHPIVHLVDVLLGVKQVKPRWKAVEISPSFLGPRSARGGLATPQGLIKVLRDTDGNKGRLELSLPRGMEALVRLPGKAAQKVAGPGTTLFNFKRSFGQPTPHTAQRPSPPAI